LVALLIAAPLAGASTTYYGSSVTSVLGTYGNPGYPLDSGIANAGAVLGAPDGSFIQLSAGSTITIDLGSVIYGTGMLHIYTIDDIFPGTADIAVSSDNATWQALGNYADTNGTPGILDIAVNNPGGVEYVKLFCNWEDPLYPGLGYDLDAVGYTPVPEASTMTLFGSLLVGLAGYTFRRRKA